MSYLVIGKNVYGPPIFSHSAFWYVARDGSKVRYNQFDIEMVCLLRSDWYYSTHTEDIGFYEFCKTHYGEYLGRLKEWQVGVIGEVIGKLAKHKRR